MGILGETRAVSIKLWPLLNLDSLSFSPPPLSLGEGETLGAVGQIQRQWLLDYAQTASKVPLPVPSPAGEGEGEKLTLNWRL